MALADACLLSDDALEGAQCAATTAARASDASHFPAVSSTSPAPVVTAEAAPAEASAAASVTLAPAAFSAAAFEPDARVGHGWPPDVVVVGGGLAGLVSALRLAEAGCRVTVVEAENRLGGKVVGFVDEDTGEALEHSMRVYMAHYTTLLEVLRGLESVQGGRTAASVWKPVQMDYLPHPQSPPLRALDLFGHYGIGADVMKLGYAITHSQFLTPTHSMSMEEWFQHYKISPAVVDFANAVMGVWTGAKPRSRASSILGSLYIVLLSMFSPATEASWSERAFRFAALGDATNQLFTAFPSNRSTIEPIRRRLLQLGVDFRMGVRVSSLRMAPGPTSTSSSRLYSRRVVGLDIYDAETGETLPPLPADAVVLAVDTACARRLYPPAFAATRPRSGEVSDEASGEWSVGCSFPVHRMEDAPLFLRGQSAAPRMVLDSPWHITYCVVPRQAFHGDQPADDATIFATASNFEDSPGHLYGKPALLCTPEEMKLEYLHQIGVSGDLAESLARRGSIGLGVEYVSRDEVLAKPWKYSNFALGPEIGDADGHRWAARSLLFIETKEAADVQTVAPGCDNLFLAGEYISSRFTTIKVPTMEKSAETGAMAAKHAMHWLRHDRCKDDGDEEANAD